MHASCEPHHAQPAGDETHDEQFVAAAQTSATCAIGQSDADSANELRHVAWSADVAAHCSVCRQYEQPGVLMHPLQFTDCDAKFPLPPKEKGRHGSTTADADGAAVSTRPALASSTRPKAR